MRDKEKLTDEGQDGIIALMISFVQEGGVDGRIEERVYCHIFPLSLLPRCWDDDFHPELNNLQVKFSIQRRKEKQRNDRTVGKRPTEHMRAIVAQTIGRVKLSSMMIKRKSCWTGTVNCRTEERKVCKYKVKSSLSFLILISGIEVLRSSLVHGCQSLVSRESHLPLSFEDG